MNAHTDRQNDRHTEAKMNKSNLGSPSNKNHPSVRNTVPLDVKYLYHHSYVEGVTMKGPLSQASVSQNK